MQRTDVNRLNNEDGISLSMGISDRIELKPKLFNPLFYLDSSVHFDPEKRTLFLKSLRPCLSTCTLIYFLVVVCWGLDK